MVVSDNNNPLTYAPPPLPSGSGAEVLQDGPTLIDPIVWPTVADVQPDWITTLYGSGIYSAIKANFINDEAGINPPLQAGTRSTQANNTGGSRSGFVTVGVNDWLTNSESIFGGYAEAVKTYGTFAGGNHGSTIAQEVDTVNLSGHAALTMTPYLLSAAWPDLMLAHNIASGGEHFCSYTGAISATTLTVSAIASGRLQPGQLVAGAGVAGSTYITSQLTGAIGGPGTYNVSVSQTIVSEAMTANPLDITAYLFMTNNGAKALSGIVFHNDAISGTDGVTGTGEAIALAKGHAINFWCAGGGTPGVAATIVSNRTTTAGAGTLSFEESGGLKWNGARVLFTALPTSAAGLPSGALWNNANVINIVP